MSELPKRAEDKVNTFGIVLIGVSSAILLWATIVLLQAYYDTTAGSLQKERDAMFKSKEVRTLRADQKANLQALNYVKVKVDDVTKELVTIPIDVAMSEVLQDLEADQEASLVPALGAHDAPTIAADPGRPPEQAPEEGAGEGEETEGEGAGEGDEEGDAPADQEAEERGATDEEEARALDEPAPDEQPEPEGQPAPAEEPAEENDQP